MTDNLKASLLFRMLDLCLKVLAFGSAPGLVVAKPSKKSMGRWLRQHVSAALVRASQLTLRFPNLLVSKVHDAKPDAALTQVTEEGLLALSPKLLAKALAKAPLVDLLQIFSDCTLDEREHIHKALRCVPLLPVPRGDEKILLRSDVPPPDLRGSSDLSSSLQDIWREEVAVRSGPSPTHEQPFADGIPAFAFAPHPQTSWHPGHFKPDSPRDPETRREHDRATIPRSMPPIAAASDSAFGKGGDCDAFIRWVDADAHGDAPRYAEWRHSPPIFEDIPQAPPRPELRSFVEDCEKVPDAETPAKMSWGAQAAPPEILRPRATPEDPLPHDVRSVAPEMPPGPYAVRTLREKPDDWETFQPLYAAREKVQKRPQSHEASLPFEKRTGGSHRLRLPQRPTLVSPPSLEPARGRHLFEPPWSPPGRGALSGRRTPGGPSPAPWLRQSLGRGGHRPRARPAAPPRTERQASGTS